MAFSEKNYLWGKWGISGPKMTHGHKSGFRTNDFLKFYILKEAKSVRIILMVSLKKSHSGQRGHFGCKNDVLS